MEGVYTSIKRDRKIHPQKPYWLQVYPSEWPHAHTKTPFKS